MVKIGLATPTASQAPGRSSLLPVYAMLSMVVVLWGGNFVAAKFIVPHMPPFTAAAVRFAIGGTCLFALLHYSQRQRERVRRSDILILAASGLFGFTLNTGLLFSAMRVATATESAVITNVSPAITVLLAALILRERLTVGKVAGCALAFAGVVVAATAIDGLQMRPDHLWADLTLLANGTSWAFYMIVSRIALRRFSALALTTYATIAGALFLLPVAVVERGWNALLDAPLDAWLGLLYMSLLATVVCLVIWNRGIARIGASRTVVFNNAVTVAGMLLAALILHEVITPAHVAGFVLVTGGIFLANRRPRAS